MSRSSASAKVLAAQGEGGAIVSDEEVEVEEEDEEREEGEGGEHCGEEGVCSVEVVLLSKTRPWGSMLELQSTT